MSYRWGADDEETAESIRAAYDLPALPDGTSHEEGHIWRGALALFALSVLLVIAAVLVAFLAGFIAHAAAAGWDFYG